MSTGIPSPHQTHLEQGMAFLATALACQEAKKDPALVVQAASDALSCFMQIFQAAALARLLDPEGDMLHLRDQIQALCTLDQNPEEAARHILESALLARDLAAKLIIGLMGRA